MELIDQLTTEHTTLLKIAHEKKQILIQNDMPRLSQLVKEEAVYLKKSYSWKNSGWHKWER
ncbi:hypothetical protein [Exiguobacterium artemiae]